MSALMCCGMYTGASADLKTIAGKQVEAESAFSTKQEKSVTENTQAATSDTAEENTQAATSDMAEESTQEGGTSGTEETGTTDRPSEPETGAPVVNSETVQEPQKSANGYLVTWTQEGLKAVYRGKTVKNTYLAVQKRNDSFEVVTPKTKKAKIYHFNKKGIGKQYRGKKVIQIRFQNKSYRYYVNNGKLGSGWVKKKSAKYYYTRGKKVTGWKKINKKYYYFSRKKGQKGKLAVNRIIYGKKPYYVDSSGVRVTSTDIQLAVNYVTKHTDKKLSASRKLSSCYYYLCTHFSYQRFYGIPVASSLPGYEIYMLSHGRGNCFRYATSFAYIAKVLGYDSRVAVGSISALAGGMTPHGWTEVKVNGYWYICDPDMQAESHGVDSYMKTEYTYSYRHACSRRYEIKVKNGKVDWR